MRIAFTTLALVAWPLLAENNAAPPAEQMESDAVDSGTTSAPVLQPAPAAAAPAPVDHPAPVQASAPVETPMPAAAEAPKSGVQPVAIKNSVFDKLTLGGTLQTKAYYHNMADSNDRAKKLSLSVSKFRVDLEGAYDEHFGLLGQFALEANGKNLGVEHAYAYYKQGHFQLKLGKLKKPFSMEALQSSTSLYTVDRGQLYSTFLADSTGYSLYDVGLTLKGGFEDEGVEVIYEAGVFNGKQSDAKAYSGAQYVAEDEGFRAKDFAGRVAAKSIDGLEAELAFSTKTAEKLTGPGNLDFGANAAYEASLAFERMGWRFQGEMAWGANHQGRDSNITGDSKQFLAFYGMALWRHDYAGGRASEALLKMEGLDPTMHWGNKKIPRDANHGKFRYTAGVNYFFTPKISLLLDYSILHPITEITADKDLTHDLDLMWRLNF